MMNIHDDNVILESMLEHGGSFAKAIALAARAADSENYLRLRVAFPDLWERYATYALRFNSNQIDASTWRDVANSCYPVMDKLDKLKI